MKKRLVRCHRTRIQRVVVGVSPFLLRGNMFCQAVTSDYK